MDAHTAIATLAMDHAGTAAQQLGCSNIAELTKRASLPGKFNIPGPNTFLKWHGYTLLDMLDVLCVLAVPPQGEANDSVVGDSNEFFYVLVRHISSGVVVSIKPKGSNAYTKITAQCASEHELKVFKTFFQQDEPNDESKLPTDPEKWLTSYRAML